MINEKDIIQIAREANLGAALTHDGGEPRVWIEGADWHNELQRFAALVAAAAQERCAAICDSMATDETKWYSPTDCANEIRKLT